MPLLSILLFALILGVFLPATRNGFFFWFGDDPGYVTKNAQVQAGLTQEGLKWAFFNIDLGNWHPLTWLSHMLDCQLYGLKPWGHHLTSVLLHAVNALLLFVVLCRMSGAIWRSMLVALVFGLHPLRVESVAWVAERKDVLAAFFWMLTLWFYARFAEEAKLKSSRAKLFYGFALAGFACGLMSKGMVVTLPFVLLLLDYWPLKRIEQKSGGTLLLEKVPFFALAVAASAVTYVAQKSWGFVQTIEKYSLLDRLGNAVISYVRYLGKMLWPVELCSFYPHPGQWPAITIFMAVIFILAISIFAIVLRRKCSWLLVGWFWYLGTLVPVIGLVQLGDVAMADRYSYLPMIGVLVAMIWGLDALTKQWSCRNIMGACGAAIILVACTTITREQIGYFKDGVTAWRHNFEVTGNIDVALYALSLSLSEQGNLDEGIKQIQVVLNAKPDRTEVRYNLALMFDKQKRADEANRHYFEILKSAPNFVHARYNFGLNLLASGRTNEATAQFQEMIRLNQDARAYDALGAMHYSSGRLNEAISHFSEALRQNPNFASAYKNLGIAFIDTGRIEEGVFHLQQALRLSPNATEVRVYLDYVKEFRKRKSPHSRMKN